MKNVVLSAVELKREQKQFEQWLDSIPNSYLIDEWEGWLARAKLEKQEREKCDMCEAGRLHIHPPMYREGTLRKKFKLISKKDLKNVIKI